MTEYHKINSPFKRDMTKKNRPFIDGEWSTPEFEYLQDCLWEWTEKVDGTNIRVIIDDTGSFTFGGRTDNAQMPVKLYDALNALFAGKENDLHLMFPAGAVLYGEGFGAKIQKVGHLYREDNGFALFDVKVGGFWLERQNVEDIAVSLDLEVVPIAGIDTLRNAISVIKSGGISASLWGEAPAEGIVGRPIRQLFDRHGSRIITKIKHKDFRND